MRTIHMPEDDFDYLADLKALATRIGCTVEGEEFWVHTEEQAQAIREWIDTNGGNKKRLN